MKERVSMLIAVLVLVFASAASGHAQSTTLTLPTSDSVSNFGVRNSGGTTLFNIRADGNITNTLGAGGNFLINSPSGTHLTLQQSTGLMGLGTNATSPRAQLEIGGTDGLLCTGTRNSGTVSALGAGVRMHWYPRKGAFRVGMAESNYWDDDGSTYPNLGLFSIAMGYQPRATAVASTAIGAYNQATGDYSLALGSNSTASGNRSIAIGTQASATGMYDMALGWNVSTNGRDGAVVIGDDSYTYPTANASWDNQITMRFTGYDGSTYGKAYRFFTSGNTDEAGSPTGVYMNGNASGWNNFSSRDLKENFRPLDGEEVLGRIRNMSVTEWNYKGVPEARYIGPVAEEFWEAFHLNGNDNKGINSISMDGVNMAGIQALERRTNDMKEDATKQNAALQAEVDQLKAELAALKSQLTALMPRLAAK